MAGVSQGGSGSQTQTPNYWPGQIETMQSTLTDPMTQVFQGNYSSPSAQALYNLTASSAKGAAGSSMNKISQAQDVSSPAKTQLIKQTSDTAIQAASGVSGDMWKQALATLSQYYFQQPSITTSGNSSGGGGVQVCWVWTHFNGDLGQDTIVMREYRDRVYGKGSMVDIGYKLIGVTVLPLMKKSKWLEWVIKYTIYKPLTSLARGNTNPLLKVYAKGWEFVFWCVGARASQKLTQATANLKR